MYPYYKNTKHTMHINVLHAQFNNINKLLFQLQFYFFILFTFIRYLTFALSTSRDSVDKNLSLKLTCATRYVIPYTYVCT